MELTGPEIGHLAHDFFNQSGMAENFKRLCMNASTAISSAAFRTQRHDSTRTRASRARTRLGKRFVSGLAKRNFARRNEVQTQAGLRKLPRGQGMSAHIGWVCAYPERPIVP